MLGFCVLGLLLDDDRHRSGDLAEVRAAADELDAVVPHRVLAAVERPVPVRVGVVLVVERLVDGLGAVLEGAGLVGGVLDVLAVRPVLPLLELAELHDVAGRLAAGGVVLQIGVACQELGALVLGELLGFLLVGGNLPDGLGGFAGFLLGVVDALLALVHPVLGGADRVVALATGGAEGEDGQNRDRAEDSTLGGVTHEASLLLGVV